MQDLLKNKFKIGGDASAAAGPVGRSGTASTDWKMSAELLSYSRTKGIFAGIDLDGTSVSQNQDDTTLYYGSPHHFETILSGDVGVPPGAVAVRSRRGAELRAGEGALGKTRSPAFTRTPRRHARPVRLFGGEDGRV